MNLKDCLKTGLTREISIRVQTATFVWCSLSLATGAGVWGPGTAGSVPLTALLQSQIQSHTEDGRGSEWHLPSSIWPVDSPLLSSMGPGHRLGIYGHVAESLPMQALQLPSISQEKSVTL